MNKLVILAILVALVIIVVVMSMQKNERFEAIRPATDEEKKNLGSLTWGCEIFSGCVIKDGNSNEFLCKLPDVVTNNEMLNYQLAGRVCKLDDMLYRKACNTPGVPTNPYKVNPSSGYYYVN